MLFKLAGRHRIKRLGPFTFKIDRPKGYVKTWGSKSFTYPCDYGYFPGVKGEDGEALDAFVGDDLSGRMESFLKLKKDQSGNLVPDETKFLVGVSDKDAKKIYALYGDEVSQRVTYESVDDLKAAVKEFKPMKKKRYESAEGKGAAMEEATPTKLAATQALERFGIKAASAKTADLYKKLLGEIMARKRGKPTEKTAANKLFRVLRDMPKGPERDALIARMSEAWAMPQYAYPADRVARTLEAKADSPARGFGRELINETRALPWDAPSSVRDAVDLTEAQLEYKHIKQYNNTLANAVDPTSLVYRQDHLPGLLKMRDRRMLASNAKTLAVLQEELKQWEALPRAPDASPPSIPQTVAEVQARLQEAATEVADLAASNDQGLSHLKDIGGIAGAGSAGTSAMAGATARLPADFGFGPPPPLKTEGASNPAGPQSMYARFRKLPRLAQGAIVTPAALLSAYGLYRGGKALVNHFSPEEKEEQPTKLGAAELAYKLAPSLANAYDAYQATSAALDAQKQQEERMRFPALHATQPERMMNAMYAMDPSSTGSFDSPPVHHRRHRRHHH
jgi:hypothetical protein